MKPLSLTTDRNLQKPFIVILAIAYNRYRAIPAIDIDILLRSTRMCWESNFRCMVHDVTRVFIQKFSQLLHCHSPNSIVVRSMTVVTELNNEIIL